MFAQLRQFGRFGAHGATGIRSGQLVDSNDPRQAQVQFLQIRLDTDAPGGLVLGEYRIPAGIILTDFHQATRTHRQHNHAAVMLAHSLLQGRADSDIGYPQVARQQLHMGQGVALSRRENTRHRRQLRNSLGQDIDPVLAQPLGITLQRPGMQYPTGKPGVECGKTSTHILPEHLVADTGQSTGIPHQQVQGLGIKHQWAAAQLVLYKQQRQRLYLGQFDHGQVKISAHGLQAPPGNPVEIRQTLLILRHGDSFALQCCDL